jgi:hypothetical protein
MSYHPNPSQLVAIGDGEAASYDYEGAALSMAAGALVGGATYALITMGLGGAGAKVVATFTDQQAGSLAFDQAAANNASSQAYVGLWEATDSGPREWASRYFGVGTLFQSTWTKIKSLGKPIIGAGALIAVAYLITSKASKSSRSKRVRRKRSFWRRRTTTVWR